MMLSLFFQFTADLDQSGGQISDAGSIILSFLIDKLKDITKHILTEKI